MFQRLRKEIFNVYDVDATIFEKSMTFRLINSRGSDNTNTLRSKGSPSSSCVHIVDKDYALVKSMFG